MKTKCYSLIPILLLSFTSYCQLKKEVGITAGYVLQQSSLPGNMAFNKNVHVSKIVGINYKITGKQNWFVQSSFYAFNYFTSGRSEFVGWIDRDLGSFISIPIDFGRNISITKKIGVATSIGIAPLIQTHNNLASGKLFDNNVNNATYKVNHYSTDSYKAQKETIYILAKASIHLQAALSKKVQLSIGADYWKGFKQMYSIDYHWTASSTSPIWNTGNVFVDGVQFSCTLGVKYALNFNY